MKPRSFCALLTACLACLSLLFPADLVGQAARGAGHISRLIPTVNVQCGAGVKAGSANMPILWGDTLTTDRGGRARDTLMTARSSTSVPNQASAWSATTPRHSVHKFSSPTADCAPRPCVCRARVPASRCARRRPPPSAWSERTSCSNLLTTLITCTSSKEQSNSATWLGSASWSEPDSAPASAATRSRNFRLPHRLPPPWKPITRPQSAAVAGVRVALAAPAVQAEPRVERWPRLRPEGSWPDIAC